MKEIKANGKPQADDVPECTVAQVKHLIAIARRDQSHVAINALSLCVDRRSQEPD